MFLRSFFVGIVWSVSLSTVWVPGFCADTNNQELAATLRTLLGASGTNQTASPVLTTNSAARSADSIWVLSANDEIVMTVFQEEDLNSKTTIDVNGMVMLPLLGEVKVGGLSLAQATAQIQKLYDKDYLVNPQVNLVVAKFAARRFAVLGQVQRPGSFDFPQNEPVSLLEAIAMAGGYTRLGAPSKVSLRRVENGTPKVFRLDAEQLASDVNNKTFQVLPNDVITVGERNF